MSKCLLADCHGTYSHGVQTVSSLSLRKKNSISSALLEVDEVVAKGFVVVEFVVDRLVAKGLTTTGSGADWLVTEPSVARVATFGAVVLVRGMSDSPSSETSEWSSMSNSSPSPGGSAL